jgi:hypothetical protein
MPCLNPIVRIVCCTVLLAALISLPSRAHSLTIENVTFADSITIGEKRVSLRGAALLRWLKLVKVYVAALYLPEQTKSSNALSDIPKRLEISYLVAIKGAEFGPAAQSILARNTSRAELAKLSSRLDRFNAAYRDVKPGDRYALTYQPGKGTELSWNGEPLVTIGGADFAAAYFGIWLGSKPLDDNLKKALLHKR